MYKCLLNYMDTFYQCLIICFAAIDGVYGTPVPPPKNISHPKTVVFNFSTAFNDGAKKSYHRQKARVLQTPTKIMHGKCIFS